jgi:hypothetical protein
MIFFEKRKRRKMSQKQFRHLEMKDLHVRIPKPLYEFLVEKSASEGVSMAFYLANVLHEKQLSMQKEVEWTTSQEKENSGFILEWVELTDEMLEKKIQELETKYHLDSKTFFKLYQEGKAPDWIEDRILWGSLYKLKRTKDDVE